MRPEGDWQPVAGVLPLSLHLPSPRLAVARSVAATLTVAASRMIEGNMCFGNYAKLPADSVRCAWMCLHSAGSAHCPVSLSPTPPSSSTAVACRMLVVLRQRFAYFAADYHLFSGRSSFHKQLIMLKRILALTARVAQSRLDTTVWPQSVAASLPAPFSASLTLDLPCIFRLFGDLFGFNFVECRNAAYNKRKLLTDLECQHTHTQWHTVATHSCGRHSMSR